MTRTVALHTNFDIALNEVANVLSCDGVAIFPTETVYGIGALVLGQNDPAVGRIYAIKQRPHTMPLPVLVRDISWLEWFAPHAPGYAHALAEKFWPGALTLIVPVSENASTLCATSSDGTIGLRCPDSDFMQALLAKTEVPLYATSANSHGKPSPCNAFELEPSVCEAADIIVDGGACPVGIASTIVDCTSENPRIVRKGEISWEAIEAAVQEYERTHLA